MKTFYTLLILLIPYALTGQECSELFFSEYVEGSSQNKALEIYNPTNQIIDLSNYTIERFSNGSIVVSDEMLLSWTSLAEAKQHHDIDKGYESQNQNPSLL